MNRLADAKPDKAQLYFSVVVLIVTAITLFLLFGNKTETAPQASTSTPVVDIIIAHTQNLHLPLKVRGTVEPEKQLTLISTVTGTVTHVSERLAPGASFNKGDVLLQVDTTLLNMELHKARSALAQAALHEQQVMAEIEASDPPQEITGLSDLAQGKPQLAVASTARASAQAAVHVAEKQLANATVRAPFNGRVMARSIQEQEQLMAGRPVAQLYATDSFLIRLPLTQEQLSMVDIPSAKNSKAGTMTLLDENTGQQWRATILRSEGFIGPNRLINIIARVDGSRDTLENIIPGSLLLAEIQGRLFENVIPVPTRALLNNGQINNSQINNGQVMLVGEDNRIRKKDVTIAWQDAEHAWISSGLEAGNKVVITPMQILADSMLVNTRMTENPAQP